MSAMRSLFYAEDDVGSLIRGSLGSMLVRPIGMVIRFGLGLAFARILGASEYGRYAYAVAWLTVLALPASLGLEHICVRFLAIYNDQKQYGLARGLIKFASVTGLACGGGVASAAILIILTPMMRQMNLEVVAIVLAILPLAVFSMARQGLLRGLDRPVIGTIPENIVTPLILSGVLIVLALTAAPVSATAAAYANVFAWSISSIVGLLILFRAIPNNIRTAEPQVDTKTWRSMMPDLIFIGITFSLMTRADVLVLGSVGTSADVGGYTVASRVSELVTFSYDAAHIAGAAAFARIYASGNQAKLQQYVTILSRGITLTAIPVCACFLLFSTRILAIFGPEYVTSAPVFRLLSVGFLLSSIGGFVIVMAYMADRQRDVATVVAISAVTNIILSIVLIPVWGTLGAGTAFVVSTVGAKFTLIVLLKKRLGVWCLPWIRIGRFVGDTVE